MDVMGVMNRQERMPLQELPERDFEELTSMMKDISRHSDYLKPEKD